MIFKDKNEQFRGAGDVVEWITEKSGIKFLVKRIYGKSDCGCSGRQKALNNLIPFNPKLDYTESVTPLNKLNEKN